MSFCSWDSSEKYRDTFKAGLYACSKCGNELFSSRSKFAHFSPWPSFTEPVQENSVIKRPEIGRPNALKIYCGKCNNGLGHEFIGDGPGEKQQDKELCRENECSAASETIEESS